MISRRDAIEVVLGVASSDAERIGLAASLKVLGVSDDELLEFTMRLANESGR